MDSVLIEKLAIHTCPACDAVCEIFAEVTKQGGDNRVEIFNDQPDGCQKNRV